MDTLRFLIYLPIGTVVMLIPIMIQGGFYNIKWYKRILIAVLLTVAGTLGTMLLFYIENGEFGGTSFFGALFFVPVLFIPIAKILGIRYGLLMDLCAPAECIMLVIMKVQCCLTGCCGGRLVEFFDRKFVFPSQIVEMITALLICIVLLIMAHKKQNIGKLFPYYLIIYGATRFVLNLFRKTKMVAFLHMPFGNFWSLVSIAIGIIVLVFIFYRKRKMNV